MSKISLEGNVSGSGTLTIAAPNTNTNYTLTLPTNTGTILTSGTAATSIPGYGNLTEVDQWRITANTTVGNSNTDITANWERVDTDGFQKIGTGMTESSGIFTFPSTGVYLITFAISAFFDTSSTLYGYIYTTTDNSTYSEATSSRAYSATNNDGSNFGCFVFNVTNTANCKVKFVGYSSGGNITVRGATGDNRTYATFVRLGNSQ